MNPRLLSNSLLDLGFTWTTYGNIRSSDTATHVSVHIVQTLAYKWPGELLFLLSVRRDGFDPVAQDFDPASERARHTQCELSSYALRANPAECHLTESRLLRP